MDDSKDAGESVEAVETDPVQKAIESLMATVEKNRPKNKAIEEWVNRLPERKKCPRCGLKDMALDRTETISFAIRDDNPDMASRNAIYLECRNCGPRSAEKWTRMGIPGNMTHCSIENYRNEAHNGDKALTAARKLVELRRGFLILLGEDCGIGKSHLAIGCLKALGRGRFITQTGFLTKLRKTYRSDHAEDIVESCKGTRLLVLDEFGLSGGGRDEFPAIYDILNTRYTEKRPTVITGNVTIDEFSDAMGPRLMDRITEAAVGIFRLAGKSQRAEQREDYFA